jgi:hypothetical protein
MFPSVVATSFFLVVLICYSINIRQIISGNFKSEKVDDNFLAVARWIEKETPIDSKIVFVKPWLLKLYSNHNTLPFRLADEKINVKDFLKKNNASYVLVSENPSNEIFNKELNTFVNGFENKKNIFSNADFSLYLVQ